MDGFFLFVMFIVIPVGIAIKVGRSAKPRAVPAAKAGVPDRVASLDESNPYWSTVTGSPLFGTMPRHGSDLLGKVMPDRDERVIATITANSGIKAGYLMATTVGVRWVQTSPPFMRSHDWAPHGSVTGRSLSGKVGVGNATFQTSPRKAKQFHELLVALEEGLRWQQQQEDEDLRRGMMQAQQQGGQAAPSASEELERLAALHQSGALSDVEFQAAKSRLLG